MLKEIELSKQQINEFSKQGFVICSGAFDRSDVEKIQLWTTEISERPEEIGKHWVYHETSLLDPNRRLINRIENMVPFHKGLSHLANSFIPSCTQLFGEKATLFKDKINFKMSGGEGFQAHQDSQAAWEKFASYFINLMVCIDRATIENGCIELSPRPGNFDDLGLIGKEWEPLSIETTSKIKFEPCPTEPGDVIYFDSYVPHKSASNTTGLPRRAYFSTYNRLSEGSHIDAYFSEKRKNFPPDIEREDGKEYTYRV